MKKRIAWIDSVKGIGIILVVLCHVMSPIMTGNIVMENIYKIIYTFHMPLFFLLGGMVSGKYLNDDKSCRKTLIFGRSKRLLIPYFVWAIIYIPMKLLMKDHVRFTQTYGLWTIILGNNPAGQLWFLYVLYILSILTIFFATKRNIRPLCFIALIVSALAPLIPSELSFPGIGLSFSLYQVGFWFLGLLMAEKVDCFKLNYKIAAVCALVFTLYCVGVICDLELWYLKMVAALSACYLVCLIAVKLPFRGIQYIGSRSMSIYILHAPLLVIGRICLKLLSGEYPWFYLILLTVVAIGISLIASEFVIKKVALLRLLLFGEN